MSGSKHKLALFTRWALEAPSNAVFVYYNEPLERDPEVFAYARKLSDAGVAFLFQKKTEDGNYQYCAKRCPLEAHIILDKVSASIHVEPSRHRDAA